MRDVKEYIEDYLMVYHYASEEERFGITPRRIHHIDISNCGERAYVWFIKNSSSEFFKYSSTSHRNIPLTSQNFKVFQRGYIIGTLLYDPENPTVYEDENITYLRYKNMLSNEICGYNESLYDYLSNLKPNSPIYYGYKRATLNKINKSNNTIDFTIDETGEKIIAKTFYNITPRKRRIEKKQFYDFNLDLNSMSTRELMRIRKEFYKDNYLAKDPSFTPKFSIEDILGILHLRKSESPKTKRKKIKKNI
jgi:hypothetical protein